MLALTRRKGESIVIGDNIEVMIISTQGDQIKLGIIAPKTVSVHRKEVYLQIKEENRKAAANAVDTLDGLKSLLVKPKK